jgi:hypothetical protein
MFPSYLGLGLPDGCFLELSSPNPCVHIQITVYLNSIHLYQLSAASVLVQFPGHELRIHQ